MKPLSVSKKTVALLLLLPLLIAACASPSPICGAASLALPPKPSASQPMPASPYSENAQRNIDRWQKSLIDTQATQKP